MLFDQIFFQRMMEVKKSLITTLVDLDLGDTFSAEDWQMIEIYVQVFKPFKDTTVIMSGDTYPTASSYVPMILGLIRNLELQISNSDLNKSSKNLSNTLRQSLKVILAYRIHTELQNIKHSQI